MDLTLEFEKPVVELENQIKELKKLADRPSLDLSQELETLQRKVDSLIKEIYTNLTPWDRVQIARHPGRPHALDYIQNVFSEFHELHGDRKFAEDAAIIAGFGYLDKQKVAVIGIEKGNKTAEKIKRNFGMPRPEGYRKALRIMQTASRFNIPIVTLVDTPGAFPGIGAEERGQAEAIADNLCEMFEVNSPILSVIIGEGGSGGALGIAIADQVLMMEYSIYSVISPESCASILWADSKMASQAANALQLGPGKALELAVIDGIIKEPAGGAHRAPKDAMAQVKTQVKKALNKLLKEESGVRLERRFQKFRAMGNQTIDQSEQT